MFTASQVGIRLKEQGVGPEMGEYLAWSNAARPCGGRDIDESSQSQC